jgi:exodeoxyribonuclease V alpha subunit
VWQSLWVLFDGSQRVHYDATELDQIVLGYAATVHKAQGSEFRIVVAPLHARHQVMLQRNLLYTCVTRAKEVRPLSHKSLSGNLVLDRMMWRGRETRILKCLFHCVFVYLLSRYWCLWARVTPSRAP